MMKLVLHSTVFLWRNSDRAVLYDCASKASLCHAAQDSGIQQLCTQWENIDNLYVARFDEQDETPELSSFIQEIVNKGFGSLYGENDMALAFPPVLSIDQGAEKLSSWKNGYDSQPVLLYLTKLQCYLGGNGCHADWWQQGAFPMASTERLDPTRLAGFLFRCSPVALAQIHLVISEWDAVYLSSLKDVLEPAKDRVRFFFAHPDPGFGNEILDGLMADGYAVTQVCPPDKNIKTVTWTPGRSYQLLIRSEEEGDYWEALLQDTESVDYDFKPIAEDNLEFFRKNVFLSEEEILSQKLTKKDIFRHQALNVNQFGTLYVFPDGTIHSAADAPAIGTLEDPVHQTIVRELMENHAWRQTRRLMEPCKNCLYHDLCPSPSVYERVFGVPGCTYWQK
jgi:hypothetical protein